MAAHLSACLVPEEGPEDDHVGDEAQDGQGAVEDYQSVVRHYWQPGGGVLFMVVVVMVVVVVIVGRLVVLVVLEDFFSFLF